MILCLFTANMESRCGIHTGARGGRTVQNSARVKPGMPGMIHCSILNTQNIAESGHKKATIGERHASCSSCSMFLSIGTAMGYAGLCSPVGWWWSVCLELITRWKLQQNATNYTSTLTARSSPATSRSPFQPPFGHSQVEKAPD